MEVDDRTTGISTHAPPRAAKAAALLGRIAPALGVFFLAPLTAEYLLGYDTSTGNIAELLVGLLFFGPLYGSPALIIRELARRTGRGWPTMILLGLAFGLIQAGLIDQSLFNTSYRDIDYWDAMLDPTFIPALGIGAYPALNFLLGHAIWSFGVPIALVETLVPARRTTPWLGKLGMTTIVIVYLLISALIFWDHVQQEQFLLSMPQLIGALAVIAALIGAAFVVGRRPQPPVDRPVPSPWLVGVVSFVAWSLPQLVEVVVTVLGIASAFVTTWGGVALSVVLIAGLTIAVLRWSRRAGWGAAHRLALAGGALLTNAWIAFLIEPLGDVSAVAKLSHNAAFALGAVALLAIGARIAHKAGGASGRRAIGASMS